MKNERAIPANLQDAALNDLNTVMAIVGVRKSAIYKWMKEGNFPEPLRLSPKCSRWRTSDIKAWLAKQSTEAR